VGTGRHSAARNCAADVFLLVISGLLGAGWH
jgi:hypothetical protein